MPRRPLIQIDGRQSPLVPLKRPFGRDGWSAVIDPQEPVAALATNDRFDLERDFP